MSTQQTDIISFIKNDTAATKVTSRGRLGVLLSYFLVPAWFLWQLGVYETFIEEPEMPTAVHFGALVAFLILGVGFFASLGKARFIRNGLWATVAGTAIMLGFGYIGQMAAWDFYLSSPVAEDWGYAWSCALVGIQTGLASSFLMLLSLFVFGPFPTPRHQTAIACLSASMGLLVLVLYCPMGDVFHMSVGHLGQFVGLFLITWLSTRILSRFILTKKIALAEKSSSGLSREG